ncbi:hypothetical protein EVAR_16107_1 [Eumeta japonica]|uniref:non-specific serine/threonine protein kinase n=1 Tax=Eumeta variegata TaxID=151549 RepID=A0A4C1UK32_EUMVA|nr:hypothetical protein EVAR_16107_1 [Eumeta japonica]
MLASAKKTSTIIGTPYYLAPELCDGKPYDTKSDVWALGCLLYEMCTHKRAFEAETLVGLIKVITGGSVHPINLSLYERGIQDLIDSMLSILPEKRPTIKQVLITLLLQHTFPRSFYFRLRFLHRSMLASCRSGEDNYYRHLYDNVWD